MAPQAITERVVEDGAVESLDEVEFVSAVGDVRRLASPLIRLKKSSSRATVPVKFLIAKSATNILHNNFVGKSSRVCHFQGRRERCFAEMDLISRFPGAVGSMGALALFNAIVINP